MNVNLPVSDVEHRLLEELGRDREERRLGGRAEIRPPGHPCVEEHGRDPRDVARRHEQIDVAGASRGEVACGLSGERNALEGEHSHAARSEDVEHHVQITRGEHCGHDELIPKGTGRRLSLVARTLFG